MGGLSATDALLEQIPLGLRGAIAATPEFQELRYNENQPRDPNGEFGDGGGSAIDGTGVSKSEAKGIATRLVAGEKPNIHGSQLGPMLDRAAKSDNPVYATADITNLRINGTHLMGQDGLGYPRSEMPQVPKEMRAEYLVDMAKEGITATAKSVDPLTLQPSQSEIGVARVAEIYAKAKGQIDQGKQILISQDNYIVDGHHHWAADVAIALRDPSQRMSVLQLSGNARDVIAATRAWTDAHGLATKALGARFSQLFEYRGSPDQPRDDHGRYASSDGTNSATVDDKTMGNRLGRCYELAGRYLMDNNDMGAHKGDVLVHGSIQGGGNPRIGHAWVQNKEGTIAWEPASNRQYPMDVFKAYFKAIPSTTYSYTDALAHMVSDAHWGPWDGGGYDDSHLRWSWIIEERYSEDQPRDDHGRFASGGGDSTPTDGVRAEVVAAKETLARSAAKFAAQGGRIEKTPTYADARDDPNPERLNALAEKLNIKDKTSYQMTELALLGPRMGGDISSWLALAPNGDIAGAMASSGVGPNHMAGQKWVSLDANGNRVEHVYEDSAYFIGAMGSMGILDGVGSAFTQQAIQSAAKAGVGLSLQPLDDNAAAFWIGKLGMGKMEPGKAYVSSGTHGAFGRDYVGWTKAEVAYLAR